MALLIERKAFQLIVFNYFSQVTLFCFMKIISLLLTLMFLDFGRKMSLFIYNYDKNLLRAIQFICNITKTVYSVLTKKKTKEDDWSPTKQYTVKHEFFADTFFSRFGNTWDWQRLIFAVNEFILIKMYTKYKYFFAESYFRG